MQTTTPDSAAPPAAYESRLERVRERLRHAGLDYCFVGPSSDLRYLTGLDLHLSERLSLLVLPSEGPAYLVVPSFELAGLGELPPGIRSVPWEEADNPARRVAEIVGGPDHQPANCTVAVSDRLWSVFLLRLQAAMPRVAFSTADLVLVPTRMVKDAAEVAALTEAAARADDAFPAICRLPFAGQSERTVAAAITGLLRERGLAIEWGPIVGSGPNGAAPHHTADDRIIQPGDLVVLDYGGVLNGYQADMTRTVAVAGDLDPEARQVYDLVYQAQDTGVQAARPGMPAEELDAVVRDYLAGGGYGAFFTHRLGHGIGLDGHEPPYLVAGSQTPLTPGMAFSIEPGLYLPGRFGVRIEDIVVMTPTGAQRLNQAPRELVTVR